jgi:DNA-binding response OmpR family regulator
MSPTPQILVVEDDDAIRALLVAALRREPFDVHAAVHGAQALNMTQATDYAVILLDLMMPTCNGLEFLEAFHAASPTSGSVIFVMTAGDDTFLRHLSSNLVHGIVRKPFDVPQLVAMVREVALTRVAHAPEAAAVNIAVAGGKVEEADPPN